MKTFSDVQGRNEIKSAAEWYSSVADFPENGDIEQQGMALIRAIQLNVLEAAAIRCDEICEERYVADEIRKMKETL